MSIHDVIIRIERNTRSYFATGKKNVGVMQLDSFKSELIELFIGVDLDEIDWNRIEDNIRAEIS